MREPTKEEMIAGISAGFFKYLKDKDYGPRYEMPLADINRVMHEEFSAFLTRHRDTIINRLSTK